MVITPNLNIEGKQFKITEETHYNPKLLKGSLGVISHTIEYPHERPDLN